MNYPNMSSEIYDAVHEYFADMPDVEADVYLYLASLAGDLNETCRLCTKARGWLSDMNRCDKCGTPLEVYHYQECHDELDEKPMEDMYEQYCPNCDIPRQMIMEDFE